MTQRGKRSAVQMRESGWDGRAGKPATRAGVPASPPPVTVSVYSMFPGFLQMAESFLAESLRKCSF